ncbi:hypothetical protein HY989_02880 [Candidatus Micrarchaeota archaeon]|nr:hypothetical protein [Candidatus Micrarchaeota archaeon]
MPKQEGVKTGFLLVHKPSKWEHKYEIHAVSKKLRPHELRMFFESPKAEIALEGKAQVKTGHINYPNSGENRVRSNVYPYIYLREGIDKKLEGGNIARNLELIASKHLISLVGNVLDISIPVSKEGRSYLKKTGRGLLTRLFWGGIRRTLPLSVSIEKLEKSIRKNKK